MTHHRNQGPLDTISVTTRPAALVPSSFATRRFPQAELFFAVGVALAIATMAALKAAGAIDLSTGAIIVISIRLVGPLLIFRYWLVGGIVAMVLDTADVILIDALGLGGFGGNYAEIDKINDSYYYVIEFIVALRWTNRWMTIPAIGLFVFRVIGAILFEVTHDHVMLFFFPNMFENWWLYCVVVMKWFPKAIPHSWKSVMVPMLILLVPKMGQEYLLHYSEAHPWTWTKEHIL